MEIRNLPVKLTETETLARGEELARVVDEYKREEAAEKARAKAAREGLVAKRQRMETLAQAVETRTEHRDVQCTWAYARATLSASLRRVDTGAEVESRPMSFEERQERLPGMGDDERWGRVVHLNAEMHRARDDDAPETH